MKTKASHWLEWAVESLFTGNKLTSRKRYIDLQYMSPSIFLCTFMSEMWTNSEVKCHIVMAFHMWYSPSCTLLLINYSTSLCKSKFWKAILAAYRYDWYKCHLQGPVISKVNKCIINLKGKKPSPCHPTCFAAGHGEQIRLFLKLKQFVLFDFSPHKLSTLVPLTQKRFATENK